MRRRRRSIGNSALNDAIFRSGKTQRLIAIDLGMAEGRLSHGLHGRVEFTRPEKVRLARYFNRAIDELFPDPEDESDPVTITHAAEGRRRGGQVNETIMSGTKSGKEGRT